MERLGTLTLLLLLTGSGCMHGLAYSSEQGGDQAGLLAGTQGSLQMIGETSVGVITGNVNDGSEPDPLLDRGVCLALATCFVADLPATFVMDVLTGPYYASRTFRSTWNED